MSHYDTLGVSKDASQEEIAKAYREAAQKYHPDKSPGDEEAAKKFKECSEAFEILNDPDKRMQYDSPFGGRGVFFTQHFHRSHPPLHIRSSIEVTLDEVRTGCTKEIKIKKRPLCDSCGGSGAESVQNCPECHGSGMVKVKLDSNFIMNTTCRTCGGEGSRVLKDCIQCQGSGLGVTEEKTIEIKVPPGIINNAVLKVGGEGQLPGRGSKGMPPGDLLVRVFEKEHEIFERRECDLLCEIPVKYTKLVFGTKVKITTLEEDVELEIPKFTKSGTPFKLEGRGLPELYGRHVGDIIVIITLDMPEKLSKRHKSLLKQLGKVE